MQNTFESFNFEKVSEIREKAKQKIIDETREDRVKVDTEV